MVRNRKTASASDTTMQRQKQNVLVQLAASGALVSLIITLACFLIIGLWQLPTTSRTLLQDAATRLAEQQVSMINARLQQLWARLDQASEPDLIDALEQQDAARLSLWQARLERQFPEAVSVRVLPLGPLGIAGLHRDTAGLRNNIEMDLLRHASSGHPAGPEAYLVNERWLVSLAQPILRTDGDHSAGAILLTVPGDLFSTRAADAYGQTEVLQTLTREARPFARSGAGDLLPAAVELALSPEHWQLRFTPSRQLAAAQHVDSSLLWILTALSTAGILSGVLLTAYLFRRSLLHNVAALTNNEPQALNLPGFADLYSQLHPRTRRRAAQPARAVDSPRPSTAGTPPETTPHSPAHTVAAPMHVEEIPALDLPQNIFRAYDVRGLAGTELSEVLAYHLGLAIGSEALERGQQTLVVARDGRESSPTLARMLIQGLRESGRDVIDIGLAPTPLLYFAAYYLDTQAGVMVTASHNPREYNGLKIMLSGRSLSGAAIQALRQRIEARQFSQGAGDYRERNDLIDAYIDTIAADVAIAQPLKVVLDAGNGVAGAVAPQLFQALGCDVVPLYCEVDGRFPHHHPDPTVADNLTALIAAVQEHEADLGLAFDGDGDRLGVVTASGQIVAADVLLMLLAQDVVARNPGADILFDVKCSRHLNSVVSRLGGRPIMWKSGHSFMKEKMLETGALLGGEFSGHIYFKERWFGFDDGLYAGARLIEILSTSDPSLDNQIAALPPSVATPELRLALTEGTATALVERLVSHGQWGDGKITTLDGIRVDYADGWGLVRPANTEPALTLRFEADSDESLQRIQQLFRDQLAAIDPEVATRF